MFPGVYGSMLIMKIFQIVFRAAFLAFPPQLISNAIPAFLFIRRVQSADKATVTGFIDAFFKIFDKEVQPSNDSA
jgi:hypothetical protein